MMRIERGADWGRSWPLSNADGTPITDFTGWTALAQVRITPDADTVLWSWSTTSGAGQGTITFAEGKVTLSHTAADSQDWTWRAGAWDLRVKNGSDQTAFVALGRVMVTSTVTRD
jgi:hypothetical protein